MMDNHKSPLTISSFPLKHLAAHSFFKWKKKKSLSKHGHFEHKLDWPYFIKIYTLNQKWKPGWCSQTGFQAQNESFNILYNIKETADKQLTGTKVFTKMNDFIWWSSPFQLCKERQQSQTHFSICVKPVFCVAQPMFSAAVKVTLCGAAKPKSDGVLKF